MSIKSAVSNEVNQLVIFMHVGWLDDIGLPQYKDQFHEARVDGRMIQYLTVVRLNAACTLTFPIKVDACKHIYLDFKLDLKHTKQ